MQDQHLQQDLRTNIKALAKANAAKDIVDEIIKLIKPESADK
jgi:hypothetical protein